MLNSDNAGLSEVRLPKIEGLRVVRFSVKSGRDSAIKTLLKIPGKHNLSNALAADALGKVLGISEKVRNSALGEFSGTWRRFEYKGLFKGAKVYDDYGHHPAEIRATLAGAKEKFPYAKVWCVFQPHHQERLRILFKEFTQAFKDADQVVIVETYKVKGREQGKSYYKKDAPALSKRIGARYARDQKSARQFLKSEVRRGDVVIIMGAGDVTELAGRLIRKK